MNEEETRRSSERGDYYVVHPALALGGNSLRPTVDGPSPYNSGNVSPLDRAQISAVLDQGLDLKQASESNQKL